MADPTIPAYNRSSRRTSYLGHVVPSLTIPGVDIAPDPSYSRQYPMWRTLRDCYEGEATVKGAGEIYLRKLSAHNDQEYEAYLSRAYFYNAVRRTHTGLMGSLFRKPVEVTLPTAVKVDLGNVTLQCQNIHAFCRGLGHELLLTGRYGILADFKEGNALSPYLAGYQAENVFAWRTTIHRDREVVDRVVLIEYEPVLTEYGRTSVMIIRVLRLDPDPNRLGELVYSQTIIRPSATNVKETPGIQHVSFVARGRTLRYIPFVFVNSTDTLPDAKPGSLEDIATINISHYQSTAHLEHGRFYAGMPTYVTSGDASDAMREALAAAGQMPQDARVVGPSNVWELEKDAKAWLLEFTGHGLTFLENAVDSKQLQMQSLGGRLISSTRRAAAMSDEAWQLLETGDEATLMDVAKTCDEAVATAITYLADIRGDLPATARTDAFSAPTAEKAGIKAEFNKEFVRSELTARELRALQSLAERGHIPVDVMYYALREVGVIPIEYSLEDFKTLLKRKDQIWTDPNPAPTPGGPGVRPQPVRPANNGRGSGTGD